MNINNIRTFGLSLFWLSLVLSCSSSEDENIATVNKNAVSFTSSITRASSSAFDEGDAISVFAFKNASGFVSESYAANKKYVCGSSRRFVASDAQSAIVYPPDGSALSFHAVYPYTEFSGSSFIFEVENNQSLDGNYTQSDLMTAATVATTDLEPPLKFSHRLSNVVFNVSFDERPSGEVRVVCKNVTTSASVDMITGTFQGTGEQNRIVDTATNGTNSYKVIIPPQTISAGTEVAMITTATGETYTWKMPETTEWKSGIQYTYDLHIDKKGAVTFMFTITPWSESGIKKDMFIGRWAWVHDKGWERYDGYFEEWDDYYTDTNPYFFFFYADGTGYDSFDPEGVQMREEYTWEVHGDQLTVHVKGEPGTDKEDEIQVAKIMKLTPTTLELEYSEPDYYSYVTLEKR